MRLSSFHCDVHTFSLYLVDILFFPPLPRIMTAIVDEINSYIQQTHNSGCGDDIQFLQVTHVVNGSLTLISCFERELYQQNTMQGTRLLFIQ